MYNTTTNQACRKELANLTEKQKSLTQISESVAVLEKENMKLENDIKNQTEEYVNKRYDIT